MTVLQPAHSPLARLVFFVICLSIAGSLVAGVHYYAVDIPAQQNVPSPENSGWGTTSCTQCKHDCGSPSININYGNCIITCMAVAC